MLLAAPLPPGRPPDLVPADLARGAGARAAAGARLDTAGALQRGAVLGPVVALAARGPVDVLPGAVGATVVAVGREAVGYHGTRGAYVVAPTQRLDAMAPEPLNQYQAPPTCLQPVAMAPEPLR